MASQRGTVSIGIAGSVGPEIGAEVAAAVERAGFHALWVNDTPGADSLEVLAAAAAVTQTLTLATGVIPLDRRPPGEIAAAVRRLGLPEERLVLGIGAGGARRGALAMVADAITALRDATGTRVLVGALGPKMRRLAAEHADGALLSWLTPQRAAEQADDVRDAAPRGAGYVALYARAAVDSAAIGRRDEEAQRYAGYPTYAANFARLGIDVRDTLLPLPGDEAIAPGVAAYTDSVDELVLRAIARSDARDDLLAFVEAARIALDTDAAQDTGGRGR